MSERLIVLRPGTPDDAPHVAAIWCAGWRDGLGAVPDELVAARTPDSLQRRAAERVRDTTVGAKDDNEYGRQNQMFLKLIEFTLELPMLATQQGSMAALAWRRQRLRQW